MGVIVRKKENESPSTVVFRFTKKVQQSGVLREARKRRFTKRAENKNKRRANALHRAAKKTEFDKARKLGKI